GQARLSFILGLQVLVASTVAFLVCIPPWGAWGAGIGYVIAAVIAAGLTARLLGRHVELKASSIAQRTKDIQSFIRKKLSGTSTFMVRSPWRKKL
ncbi:MAG TPA: hypothetical protein VK569_07880, partial [Bacteroidota bacterium]|nr:hypothetical protein [Bacteroidota bacterium]